MCEARLSHGSLLKKLIDCIKPLVVEANLAFDEEGLSLKCMDAHHVALVEMVLHTAAFDVFQFESRNIMLGISLEAVQTILKCSTERDCITLKSTPAADTLDFVFERPGCAQKGFYSVKLLQLQSDSLGIPEGKHPYHVTMSSKNLEQIVKDLSKIGDTVIVEVTPEHISFKVKGDFGKGEIVCEPALASDDEDDRIQIVAEAGQPPLNLRFGLKYLATFGKSSVISNTVQLHFSAEEPLILEYPLSDAAGRLRWLLAPRVEEEATTAAPAPSSTS